MDPYSASEQGLDDTIESSFPASDPLSTCPAPVADLERTGERHEHSRRNARVQVIPNRGVGQAVKQRMENIAMSTTSESGQTGGQAPGSTGISNRESAEEEQEEREEFPPAGGGARSADESLVQDEAAEENTDIEQASSTDGPRSGA